VPRAAEPLEPLDLAIPAIVDLFWLTVRSDRRIRQKAHWIHHELVNKCYFPMVDLYETGKAGQRSKNS
jgi:hypothetical protein